MMTRAHRLSFLKVLAAVAWADGVVEESERNRIKVLFNGFDLDPADRKEVDVLLDRPVSFERALDLTKEFAGAIGPPGARKQLLEEIEEMLGASADRTDDERELLEHVSAILSDHTLVDGLVEKLRGVFSKTFFSGDRDRKKAGGLTDFAKNSALHRVAELAKERGWSLSDDLHEWNRVTLLGVLLARIAHLDEGWQGGEREVVEKVLRERFRLDDAELEVLGTVMHEERDRDTDLQRICAEYCRVSTMEERLEILEALFAVASADTTITKEEVERIREIANFLWISNPEYLSVHDRYRDRIAR